jgi:hypothetical protein
MRRGLEQRPAANAQVQQLPMTVARSDLIVALHELIAALDVRLKHVERVGEAAIARDAAALKRKAMKRLAELEDSRPRRRAAR